jgi:GT2 family glycosyltransferase
MDITIIIVSWNTRNLLKNCIASIEEQKKDLKIQIIVVDNNSSDGSRDMIKKHFPDVQIINSGGNLGFAKANNLAVPQAKAPHLLFLNPDTIIKENTLQKMKEYLDSHPDIGALGCKAINLNDTVQELIVQWFPTPFTEFLALLVLTYENILRLKKILPFKDPNYSSEVSFLFGMCLMVRKVVIEQVGAFDERFFMYSEDLDLCRRIRDGGWKLYYLSEAEIIHVRGAASKEAFSKFSILMYRESRNKLIGKYYGKFGMIRYRIVSFLGSNVRLFMIYVLKILESLRLIRKKNYLDSAYLKYLTILRWSLNIDKPVIKN